MYRTAAQIESAMQILASWFPHYFTRIALPEASVEGRPIHALRLRAGDAEERRGVLIVGGTHARELMNPDAIIELAIDLLVSHVNDSDIVYGRKVWPAATIRIILETLDIWLFPCINPDGRHHVMTVDDMWRKNLRDNPGTSCDGVDLNRNLDFLWGVTEGVISCSPCSEVFCGPSAFSEPETRNVKYLLDTRSIGCFVDVHSFSELILYPWGHAPTQTTDPSKRFTGLPSGTCSPIGDPGYAEYMTPRDKQRFETVAQRIVDAIQPVRGRVYTPQTSYALYPTTGTHGDYVYSRHIADANLGKTYSYTFETGPAVGNAADSFHPTDPDPIKLDAKSGMIALAQQCICAIDLIGIRLLGRERDLAPLRRIRDESLTHTEAGRDWIGLYDRVQGWLLELVVEDQALAGASAELLGRALALLEQGRSLESGDIDRAQAFLDDLEARAKKGELPERGRLRGDLRAVRERLSHVEGYSPDEVVEELMKHPPESEEGTEAQ